MRSDLNGRSEPWTRNNKRQRSKEPLKNRKSKIKHSISKSYKKLSMKIREQSFSCSKSYSIFKKSMLWWLVIHRLRPLPLIIIRIVLIVSRLGLKSWKERQYWLRNFKNNLKKIEKLSIHSNNALNHKYRD